MLLCKKVFSGFNHKHEYELYAHGLYHIVFGSDLCYKGNCPLNFVVKKTSDVLENTRQLIKELMSTLRSCRCFQLPLASRAFYGGIRGEGRPNRRNIACSYFYFFQLYRGHSLNSSIIQ